MNKVLYFFVVLKGAVIAKSELKVSGAEMTCLLLMLCLLIYSVLIFFRIWKKNYRMPEGVFYFEEKIVEKTVKRRLDIKIQMLRIQFLYILALRTETQISMNFVPWKEIEICEKSEASQALKVCKIEKKIYLTLQYCIYG